LSIVYSPNRTYNLIFIIIIIISFYKKKKRIYHSISSQFLFSLLSFFLSSDFSFSLSLEKHSWPLAARIKKILLEKDKFWKIQEVEKDVWIDFLNSNSTKVLSNFFNSVSSFLNYLNIILKKKLYNFKYSKK